nr:nuclear transport factor 2 family protein [Allomuricauda sp.]
MKTLPHFIILLIFFQTHAQTNTEVYLFDLSVQDGKPVLSNPKNISNNHGYDNQPSFLDDHTLLFSSNRADQTDILQFNIEGGSTSSWITNTPTGSEYSPLKIPGKNTISAIRLDLDGLQLLYEYNLNSGESKPILPKAKVGYHVWFNSHILIATILVDKRMDLVVYNLKENTSKTVAKNVGRSLHKIPDSHLVSFISKQAEVWNIKSLNPLSGEIGTITEVPSKSEDICWLNASTILSGNGKTIVAFDANAKTSWQEVMRFGLDEINNISRMCINPSGNRLAFVAEVSPKGIVDRQVRTFNARDLFGFVSNYTEDVIVERFPNQTMYKGRQKMTEDYDRFYQNTKEASVEVVNRIQLGQTVIDEEISLVDGRKGHQVAIYEIKNGFIASMRFIFPDRETGDSEAVVQTQLEAYNNRDIDAFMDTYSEDIQLYNFPNMLLQGNRQQMQESYKAFFEKTPNLQCKIQNRIVIGNKVIDHELVTVKDGSINAVAIYEVENGKITRVTFIRD